MSKILRRPMFRGGPVDSRGTGITSGLMDGGRVGYKTGGDILKDVNRNFDLFYQDPNMDQLRAFQSLGMGNPFRNKFDLVGRLTRPAENSIFNKMKEAAPIVQEQKQFEEDTDKNQEILENKEFFSGNIDDVTSQIKTTDDDNDTTGNNTSATEISAQDLIRENAELFKELLGEGQKEKIKKARIGDASDYLLKFFEGTQKEGATVGSAAADVAGFATSRDSRTEKARAANEKIDQTATVLAINDYIAGKRSKEDIMKALSLAKARVSLTEGTLGDKILKAKGSGPVTVTVIRDVLRSEPEFSGKSVEEFDSTKADLSYEEGDENKIFIDVITKETFTYDKNKNKVRIY